MIDLQTMELDRTNQQRPPGQYTVDAVQFQCRSLRIVVNDNIFEFERGARSFPSALYGPDGDGISCRLRNHGRDLIAIL